jgi:hypothetical protein
MGLFPLSPLFPLSLPPSEPRSRCCAPLPPQAQLRKPSPQLFRPALSAAQSHAIQTMGMGLLNKAREAALTLREHMRAPFSPACLPSHGDCARALPRARPARSRQAQGAGARGHRS